MPRAPAPVIEKLGVTVDWNPITRKELTTLLASEEARLDEESANLFKQIRVIPYAVPIHRGSKIESVFVVAKKGQNILFYEDVEEGFEWSSLNSSGQIESYFCNQWELSLALKQVFLSNAT
jgi:hypothetical protein